MKRALITLALILLASLPFCWATTTVTGNMKNLGGSNVTGGFMRFWLRGCAGNQPRVNGTGLIAPTLGGVFYFDFPANASGAISGTLYSNRDSTGLLAGEIECGGSLTATWYGMQAFLGGKGGPEVAIYAKNGASIDISNVTPITTNPVVNPPNGDSTYARLDAGNQPFTGSIQTAGYTCINSSGFNCLPAGAGSFFPQNYGALSNDSATSLTCTSASSSANLACTSIGDFVKGQWVMMPQAGPACGTAANTTCTAPSFTVTPEGTTGATTYNYQISTMDSLLGIGTASTAVQIVNGNATLSNTNFNYLAVASPTNLLATYLVWCKAGAGSYNYVGSFGPSITNFNGPAFYKDASCAAVTPPPGVPNTPPASPLNEALSARITGIGGTTLTVSVSASNAVTNGTAYHDDAPMIQAAITAAATGGQVILNPYVYLIETPIQISCIAARLGIVAYGAALDGQYDGALLHVCNMPSVQRPEDITISGLRINGAANGLLSGSAARIAKENAYGGQIGEEIDGVVVARHYGVSVFSVPGAGFVVVKGAAGFAEQISFNHAEVRYIGGPCLTTGANQSAVAALDDVELYASIWNNCGDMYLGGTIFSADYAGVFLYTASATLSGNEISAVRNQDNVNGMLSGIAVRGGNAIIDKTHLEGNGAYQSGSREMFLDGEGGSVISATDCAGVPGRAQTCIVDNGDNEHIIGVSNNTNAPSTYVNLVDVSGATNAHVAGVSNKNCTMCAPSNAYVLFTSTQFNELGPDPAFTQKRIYGTEQINGTLGVNIKPVAANTLVQVDNGTAVAATNIIRLSGGLDFGHATWQYTTDDASNLNDYMLLGVDGNNDALRINQSNGFLQGKYGLQTPAITFGSLGTCNTAAEGTTHEITDAPTSALALGTLVTAGGGNLHAILACNGTNWYVASLTVVAPTISSGFGTSPSIVHSGPVAGGEVIQINVGTGGVATSGVIGLPLAPNGWSCPSMSNAVLTWESGYTTSSVTVTASGAWAGSSSLFIVCFPF